MCKMKSIVISVLVLVFAGFSLHAETKINENKLTDITYVRKICNITDSFQSENDTIHELDNDKGCYVMSSDGYIACIIVLNDELYGRMLIAKDGVSASCNLHDKLCYISPKVDDGTRQHITSMMKSVIFSVAAWYGLQGYIND